MPTPLSRDQAWDLLTEWVESESLRKHCLAVEASMRAVARERAPEQEELWGITGLLHDIDYERYPDLETGHPRKALELLEGLDVDPEITHAIAAHAPYLGVAPQTDAAKALLAVDELSGFVLAVGPDNARQAQLLAGPSIGSPAAGVRATARHSWHDAQERQEEAQDARVRRRRLTGRRRPRA